MARPRSLQDAPEDDGFPIRVASRMSGIEADTLRVWERRYGFPRPQRTQGGTRVYSRADVEVLKLIASALREGFRPSDVVGKSDEELARLLRAAGGRSQEEVREPAPRGSPRGTMDIVQSILDAVVSDDGAGLRDELRRAAVLLGPKQFVVEVAGPLAVRVGELWQQGRVEVRHEHLLSEALSTQLRLLSAAFEETGGSRVVLLATPPRELHGLGLEMTAVYLATRGVTPRTLGCDVPFDQIVAAAKGHDANAVGVSISEANDLDALSFGVRGLARDLPEEVGLWLGGAGAPRIASPPPRARIIRSWFDLDDAVRALDADPAMGPLGSLPPGSRRTPPRG